MPCSKTSSRRSTASDGSGKQSLLTGRSIDFMDDTLGAVVRAGYVVRSSEAALPAYTLCDLVTDNFPRLIRTVPASICRPIPSQRFDIVDQTDAPNL